MAPATSPVEPRLRDIAWNIGTTQAELDELRQARDALIVDALDTGLSLRAVGKLAGITAPRVQRIRDEHTGRTERQAA